MIRNFFAIIACICVAGAAAYAMPLEATAVSNFPVMKSEEAFGKLLDLLRRDDRKAVADFFKTEGTLMPVGTEVVLLEVGCDGHCIKFRVKGDPSEYWTVLEMDRQKVFHYKK
ncbi:MAG TPA: hypothetical protein VK463_14875 [Desulfomonilaceae bacterium]|nr:hypothetical protein [Desulfomonilaceae bacterium]